MNSILNILFDTNILNELTDNIDDVHLYPEIIDNIISLTIYDYAETIKKEIHPISETRSDFRDTMIVFQKYNIVYEQRILRSEDGDILTFRGRCLCAYCAVMNEFQNQYSA